MGKESKRGKERRGDMGVVKQGKRKKKENK